MFYVYALVAFLILLIIVHFIWACWSLAKIAGVLESMYKRRSI